MVERGAVNSLVAGSSPAIPVLPLILMVNSHYESVLSSAVVGDLQNYAYSAEYQAVEQLYKGEVYQSVFAHRPPKHHRIEKYIVQSFLAFNKEHFDYDLWGSFEVQFLKYNPGGKYDWHCDYGISETGVRKLSMSIQLSSAWEYNGGDLVIRDWHNRKHYISKEVGNVVVFDSRAPHKVDPITHGERYAIVAWAHGPELR